MYTRRLTHTLSNALQVGSGAVALQLRASTELRDVCQQDSLRVWRDGSDGSLNQLHTVQVLGHLSNLQVQGGGGRGEREEEQEDKGVRRGE